MWFQGRSSWGDIRGFCQLCAGELSPVAHKSTPVGARGRGPVRCHVSASIIVLTKWNTCFSKSKQKWLTATSICLEITYSSVKSTGNLSPCRHRKRVNFACCLSRSYTLGWGEGERGGTKGHLKTSITNYSEQQKKYLCDLQVLKE